MIQNIGTNLASPADVGFVVFQRLRHGAAFLQFQFVQLCLQLFHALVAILVLAAITLALHHNAGWHVGDSHRGICAVDVLATGTAGTIGVDAQIRGIDVDFDGVIDLG